VKQIVGSTFEEVWLTIPVKDSRLSRRVKNGKIIKAKADRPENAMPEFINGGIANSTGWNWAKATEQWGEEICIEWMEIDVSKNITNSELRYEWVVETVSRCSKWQMNWGCSAGSGLYTPIKEEGHFMNAPVIPESLFFECPPDFSSINCLCPADDGNM